MAPDTSDPNPEGTDIPIRGEKRDPIWCDDRFETLAYQGPVCSNRSDSPRGKEPINLHPGPKPKKRGGFGGKNFKQQAKLSSARHQAKALWRASYT